MGVHAAAFSADGATEPDVACIWGVEYKSGPTKVRDANTALGQIKHTRKIAGITASAIRQLDPHAIRPSIAGAAGPVRDGLLTRRFHQPLNGRKRSSADRCLFVEATPAAV